MSRRLENCSDYAEHTTGKIIKLEEKVYPQIVPFKFTIASSILMVTILVASSNEYLGSLESITPPTGLRADTVINEFCDHVTVMTVSIPKASSMVTSTNSLRDGDVSVVELDN